jgi:hypothetical protein
LSVEQVIAELQPQGMAPLPEELRQQGLAAELDEHGRVRVRRTAAAGVAGGDSMARTAGLRAGGVERVVEEGGGGVADMVEELRGMGLRAEVDPDTGLVDIAHPDAPPSRFAYPAP